MFKIGETVVLKNSSQNKVMKIQAYSDEFIRAYRSKRDYSFAHESNFRHATEQEIAAGHRIDLEELRDCDTFPNCKKYELGVENND